MDANRFDALSRSFARRFSRRTAAKAAGAAGLAAIPIVVSKQAMLAHDEGTPEASPSAEAAQASLLFTQIFQSGTSEAAMDVTGIYRLTLVQNPQQTIFFAERPSHWAGMVSTEDFFNWLSFDPSDPPNAAFVTSTPDDEEYIAVVQLTNPQFQAADNTISYDVKVIDDYAGDKLAYFSSNADNGQLPATFDAATLFIDSQDNCSGSGGLCGLEQGCCPGLTCQYSGRFGICQ